MAREWPETPDDPVDPALAPLIEAGEGESEGFELAEADLIDHAEHGDSTRRTRSCATRRVRRAARGRTSTATTTRRPTKRATPTGRSPARRLAGPRAAARGPCPGSSRAARPVAAAPSRSASARNFSSRSPVISVTGIVSSRQPIPQRLHHAGPEAAQRFREAVRRVAQAVGVGGGRDASGWPANSGCSPHSRANSSTPIASISFGERLVRVPALLRAPSGPAMPGLAPTRIEPVERERERRVERDPAAHRVAGERERLAGASARR